MSDVEHPEPRAGASAETKAKFREALQKKKAAQHPSEPAEHEAPVSHTHGSESSIHEFRRKSG